MSTLSTQDYWEEHWEAVLSKNGDVAFCFDAPSGFMPSGDLISASTDPATGTLALIWENRVRVRLADGGYPEMIGWLAKAPRVRVWWTADDLTRGSELRPRVASGC